MQDGSIILEKFGSVETGPLANVLACEGRPGKVWVMTGVRPLPGNGGFVVCME